jgi:UDP-N-acetylglucosamine 2-epimerase (non-hydrolysing)
MIAIVLGTRPEIIKLAPVMSALADRGAEFTVIHTNQHYAEELDARFFEELDLPAVGVHLGVGSGSHGEQTGRMLERVEAALRGGEVSRVVVQGDTNSGLAGALAAAKLHLSVAHVEAGLRSFDRQMPEELNRRLIDHLSDDLFPPTPAARQYLLRESVPGHVHEPTGNTIVDAVKQYGTAFRIPVADRGSYALVTLHRPESVDVELVLRTILDGVNRVLVHHGLVGVFPAHPRTRRRLEEFDLLPGPHFELIPPTSFRALLDLQAHARLVMTDSGGLQDESCILGTPCVTLRNTTERPETVEAGANIVAGVTVAGIVSGAERMLALDSVNWPEPLGDGRAAQRIVAAIAPGSAVDPDELPPELAAPNS